MALFPFFINIEGKKGLIAGGGRQALEKVNRLLPYGPSLTLISPDFEKELRENRSLELVCRRFGESDLEKRPDFVIAASGDREENREISRLCRERGILVNAVDDREYCEFIFPSLIQEGSLSIGICTDGASPAAGVLLKKRIEEQIPDNIEEILEFLRDKRTLIQERIGEKKRRYAFYYCLAEACLENNGALSEDRFQNLMKHLS